MTKRLSFPIGILLILAISVFSEFLSSLIPNRIISGGVFAMLIGMAVHPLVIKIRGVDGSFKFVSKRVLKFSIILMGMSLSFVQVLEVGKFSLIVMCFTLATAFGFGWLIGKLFKLNWKLSGLISAGTGICGGSAIAALAPVMKADDNDVAYSISAIFLFDIIMVVIFPLMGRAFGMSDMGFGLWAGTAVNDTSAVVAAGYAFSDLAGNFAVIVKLTRTLSIIPVVLIYSFITLRNERHALKAEAVAAGQALCQTGKTVCEVGAIVSGAVVGEAGAVVGPASDSAREAEAVVCQPSDSLSGAVEKTGVDSQDVAPAKSAKTGRVNLLKIFPWFILGFLAVVGLNSLNVVPVAVGSLVSKLSKFLMVTALCAIGLNTDFKRVAKSGFKPMLHGTIVSILVVGVSFLVQFLLGQL